MDKQTVLYSIAIILIIALFTYLTRVAPFLLFSKRGPTRWVSYLGGILPPAVMAVLVVYCLRGVNPTVFPFGLPELIAVAFVAIAHLWKKNIFISIFGGTALYMFFVQFVFLR